MNWYVIVLRVIHFFAGIAWAGTGFFMAGSVLPAVRKAGPEGGRVMGVIAGPGRYSQFMGATATLTVLSGLLLFWRASGGLDRSWFASGHGWVLTIGALAGLAAWLHGAMVISRLDGQITKLGKEIQAVQGPPPPEKLAEMQSLQEKQSTHGNLSLILIALAVLGMSIAEYIWF